MSNKEQQIEQLEQELVKPDFWQKQENANKTIRKLQELKSIRDPFHRIIHQHQEIEEFLEILEKNDTASLSELNSHLTVLKKDLDSFEFKSLLNQEEDSLSAILSINAGAGGTEATDWANMLLRMYIKWAEKKNYSIEWIDSLPGEETGYKNVTVILKGPYAYGYLKTERGVHRLVRISPFDANKRRHTSFASVDVIPEVSDDIKIDIKQSDLRIDTYRAGGKGGQHVNVTDSAVRITHIPSGIVAQCQNERSQYKNKSTAMKVLKARLYEKQKEDQLKNMTQHYQSKKRIEWGSQIRSYVLHPYSMVKDHRTNYETSNTTSVLNGNLDSFMEAALKNVRNT